MSNFMPDHKTNGTVIKIFRTLGREELTLQNSGWEFCGKFLEHEKIVRILSKNGKNVMQHTN